MQPRKLLIPQIPSEHFSAEWVQQLLAIIQSKAEEIARLREEVQTLKDEVAPA